MGPSGLEWERDLMMLLTGNHGATTRGSPTESSSPLRRGLVCLRVDSGHKDSRRFYLNRPDPLQTPSIHLIYPYLFSSNPPPLTSPIMSGLVKILGAMSALQPQPPTEHYDGLEYRWKALTFRPAEFKLEGAIFGVLALYLIWYLVGKSYNLKRAKAA
jgi:hypothetical protein